ncbi:MAG: zinc-dependent metalloprotease [Carboxylicivirga sp.]|jgi:hypothetical protein|nr:zinc-dependent metalloprotease [Carboxylicivirga sp.]
MIKKLVIVLILIGGVNAPLFSQWSKLRGKKKEIKAEAAKDSTKKKKDDYEKLLKDATVKKGFFNIIEKEQKYYFEIPNDMLGRDLLLSNRVTATSNNKDVSAGQIPKDPFLITFTKDEHKVYLHQYLTNFICDPNESIYEAYKRNNLTPILKAFDIKACNQDSTSTVIEVTSFFSSNEKCISPFMEASILDAIMKTKKMSGTFQKAPSHIKGIKAFEKNVQIKSSLSFLVSGDPFTCEVTRNIILLREKPYQPRISDDRVGYFSTYKGIYTTKEDKIIDRRYIHRWDLQPKDADREKFLNGELVEPQKPIVFYVDPCFPEKWKKYIKLGIEDWQKAFEKVGFKNAIQAREYPDDPNFDPDDITNSCFRYVVTRVANAMGPSYVDPRSGEILSADVLFYHNVISLLHKWRFVQTAAVDPKVRQDTFDEETMGESLRYVAAHEIGHCIGLMHNMGASFSYPVDSLRSSSFTHKYGTTPSIMDYARNNYVAQPGDKDVSLIPPLLGVYDYYAIKWGYQLINEANNEEDEKTVLNQWILDAQGDPMLRYGAQQFLEVNDPRSLNEALGNDAIKAGNYGIANLKVIMNNLKAWTTTDNETYKLMQQMHKEVFVQFNRYMGHAKVNLGGIYENEIVAGDNQKAYEFVSKAKQKESLMWILNSVYEMENWLVPDDVQFYSSFGNDPVSQYQNMTVERLLGTPILAKLATAEKQIPKKAYSQRQYINDMYDFIFRKTKKHQRLNYNDRQMQYTFVKAMLRLGNYDNVTLSQGRGFWDEEETLPCFNVNCQHHHADETHIISRSKESDVKINVRPIVQYYLKRTKALLQQASKTTNLDDRIHYEHIVDELNKMYRN